MKQEKADIKAQELIEKFAPKCAGNSQSIINRELAKQCALTACDEILESFDKYLNKPLDNVYQDIRTPIGISQITEPYKHFWESVKQSINNSK